MPEMNTIYIYQYTLNFIFVSSELDPKYLFDGVECTRRWLVVSDGKQNRKAM